MEITKQKTNIKIKGILTLIGGFFILLMNGSIFLWGTLNVYITSYFRQKNDPDLSLSIGGAVFPLMTASLATGIPLGIKGIKLFGQARYSLLLSTVITSLMVILSSYAEKFYQFAIIYGVINGIAAGSIYFVPIYMGYLHFPNNRGIVSGINTCGFALCSFLFGLLFTHLVNPDGLQQNSNSDGYSYFDGDSISVAHNVPEALRTIGYIFLGVSVCASQLIFYHPNQIGEEEKRLKKQLQLKQLEKKHFQENLITIEQEIKQIDLFNQQNIKQFQPEQAQVLNNQKCDQSQQDLLRQSQQIFIQKIKISQMEEMILQEKIEISHKKDEQTGLAFANPTLIDEIKQNSEKLALKKDKQAIEDDYQKIIQLMQNESLIHNKEQHVNLYVQENDESIELTKQNLTRKEEEIKEELKHTQKKQQEIDELDKSGAPNIILALKQPKFYLSIFLVVLCLGFGSLINANYKSIAKDYGFKTDSFQTLVGSLAGIANGISRPVWAGLLDRFKFKNLLILIICIQITISLSFQATSQSEVFFAIWVFIAHFCFGGVLGMLPVFSAQLNGVKIGSQLFGFYWYGFSIANLIQFVLVLELKKQIGFNNIFYIYFGQLVVAFIIMNYFQFKIQWSKYYLNKKKEETLNTQSQENIQTIGINSEQNKLNLVAITQV
ncbi:oxalate/formate antiporter family transporter (macronuclear) [Tetrahymena thermophila SB210]|uniref:Oxalate/formate antiporter family transporter n=1 Tax=Tetrahymena thermophila (strain SB210) TaxID=312017 RepID=Q23UB1_TETTS|nr:oxalate/formate antiporter family transporter [Tetrahymena thermophila SB210]EAS00154.1 oxalate/formate antiporter family transporter [Tetrahymena thermophila SB210]|eukprot:XP_001020399.1 oxalate/formate antiporter family transporter [Tetrahymena thermophila SB210]